MSEHVQVSLLSLNATSPASARPHAERQNTADLQSSIVLNHSLNTAFLLRLPNYTHTNTRTPTHAHTHQAGGYFVNTNGSKVMQYKAALQHI